MIKAVIFDNDGTILKNDGLAEGNIAGFKRVFDELGIDARLPTKDDILQMVGLPNPDFFERVIPKSDFDRAYPLAYRYCLDECIKLIRAKEGCSLFPGVIEMLSALKAGGVKIGLATNGEQEYIESVADSFGLRDYFDVVMSVEQVTGDKGALVTAELGMLEVKPEVALMVGDRASDIAAARKAGCKCVGVTYGYGSRKELKNADFVVDDIREIVSIVENGG